MDLLDFEYPPSEDEAAAVVIGRGDISDFNPENILPKSEAEQASIHAWLRPTWYAGEGSEYDTHHASHLTGTGDWVFDSDIYRQWHDSPEHGILWVRGAGKSVLASTIIAKLQKEETPVLYFFFRYSFDTNNTTEALLRDCLAQALRYSPPLQQELVARMPRWNPLARDLSLAELWQYLYRALMHLPRVYLVIDAMDELMPENLEPLLKALDALGRWRPAEIKLVVTSRPLPTVERILSKGVKTLDVRLDQNSVEKDIAVYVQHRLREIGSTCKSSSQVEEMVIKRSEGLFLYAKLAIDSISSAQEDPLVVLARLPADLPTIYSDILREHAQKTKGGDSGIQEFILQLVTHASRPLRLLEIADLLHATRGGDDLGATKDQVRLLCGPLLEILPDETTRIVHHSLTEYLTRSAPPSDLESRVFPAFCYTCTHRRLAISCLSYLASGCLEKVKYKARRRINGDVNYTEPASLDRDVLLPPFTRYAGANWAYHLRKSKIDCKVHDHKETNMNEILDALLVDQHLDKVDVLANTQMNFQPTPLHIAIALELDEYANYVLFARKSAYMQDSQLDSSLILYAASKGNEVMVKLLLDHGADTKVWDERGRTPLHQAAARDYVKVATILLAAGMCPDISRGDDCYFGMPGEEETPWTPLERVFSRGSNEMAMEFYKKLQSTELVTKSLHQASQSCNRSAVELLLQHPQLDINAYYGETTPLYAACLKRDLTTVEMLLTAGAVVKPKLKDAKSSRRAETLYWFRSVPQFEDPELDGVDFSEGFFPANMAPSSTIDELGNPARINTVLHAWANPTEHCPSSEHQQLSAEGIGKGIRLLVEHGADVNQINENGKAPILLAKDAATARALLECGANADEVDLVGKSLLHLCYVPEVLDVILPKADLNLRNYYTQRTPLLSTLVEGYQHGKERVSKALQLIESGADISITDKYKNSALHLAIGMKDRADATTSLISLIEKLCSLGSDVNAKNYQGKTPLHMNLPGSGRVDSSGWDMIRFEPTIHHVLLENGADINLKDLGGKTPLFQYLEAERVLSTVQTETFDAFIQAGASLDTLDSAGRSLLHARLGSSFGFEDPVLYSLIEAIGPTVIDNNGNTLFHETALKIAKQSIGRPSNPSLIKTVVELGVDPRKPNHLGRTPFHIIASIHPAAFGHCSRYHKENANEWSGFDLFLKQYPDQADLTDNHGVRPLHLACTFSEYMTRRLLEEGADHVSSTKEGLTPFHLAARSRQANIIGILLDAFEPDADPEEITGVLDLKDIEHKTALYYAAASGCVETFQLLIAAGASIDQGCYHGSAWNGCADFETELSTWAEDAEPSRPFHRVQKEKLTPDSGGVFISDQARPKSPDNADAVKCPFPSERLNEIIEILSCYTSREQISYIDQAILSAAERGYDYTVECLLHACGKITRETNEYLNVGVKESSQRRKQQRPAAQESCSEADLVRMMSLRQYDEVLHHLNSTSSQKETSSGYSPLLVSQLAVAGFAQLVSKAASGQVISITEGRDRDSPKARTHSQQALTSPLISACWRRMPNLSVVKALVEESGVSVNVRTPKINRSSTDFESGETALHVLARGGHRWQWKEAIPYLVGRGADINAVESSSGLTPLGCALQNIDGPHFSRQTVQVLLELGADPNIRMKDRQGGSYLSWTTKHPEIFQLLLRHGATIDRSALVSAIRQQDIDLVKMLLDHGVDPNERKRVAENSRQMARSDPDSSEEMYLIDLIASPLSRHEPNEVQREIFQLLLSRGANPFGPYIHTTVLHRVMENRHLHTYSTGRNVYLDMLLGQPGLDLETRDSEGRTLFLLAVKHTSDNDWFFKTAEKLLEGGADISARDSKGRNATHYAYKNGQRRRFINSKDPTLLSSPDNEGKTPLHYILAEKDTWSYRSGPSCKDIALEVIAEGLSVMQADHQGQTPLHALLHKSRWTIDKSDTVQGDSCEQLDHFVALGADPNARNKDGETPVFAYAQSSSVSAEIDASVLGPCPEGILSNSDAVNEWRGKYGTLEFAKSLEKEYLIWDLFERQGIDLHACNAAGENLLHIIARRPEAPHAHGEERAAVQFKVLIGKGLDATKEDAMHRSPLDLAAELGKEYILTLFKTKC